MRQVLDEGLDELAVSAHAGFAPRVGVTLAVAAVFTLIAPLKLCIAFAGVVVALELQAWFATRRQFLRQPVGWRTRLWHIAGLGASCLVWTGMGGILWGAGSVEGPICAVLVWASVLSFSQINAYQSPAGFVVGGALPAAAILAIVWLGPNPLHLRLLPVGATLVLFLVFAADGVGRMLSARKGFNEAQNKLRRSEAQYRVLADNVTDVIALTGVDGRRIYISPSIEAALGYNTEHLYATPNYTYLHPDDRERVSKGVAELASVGGERTIEYRVVRVDGAAIWVETSFSLAPGDEMGGQIVSVSRNIEARKALEAELIEAREAAESAAAAKSDFLANMTHELRTPLNAIIGFSGVLQDSPRLADADSRHVRLIRQASVTLLDLVNSVLDFSKLDAGAVELDPEPFDPKAEVEALAELLGDQAAAKGLSLDVQACETGIVLGDAKRLRQVLMNFLSNAIKFTADGGVSVVLTAGEVADERVALRFEVSDTGVGIPPSQIAHVFERFTQADVSISRQFGGTGLGLAICKRLVDLMHGRIGATSREGQGSVFWFEVTLPRTDLLGAARTSDTAPDLERPLRLLLVEDVAINRELVRTVLAPFDIEIETAEDGVEAIEAFRGGSFDLVLMDVQMPVMDGLTAARRIRALPLPAASITPIIAMTANVLPDQIARCLEAGMDDHLGKPMSPARLVELIAYWTSHPRPTASQVAQAS